MVLGDDAQVDSLGFEEEGTPVWIVFSFIMYPSVKPTLFLLNLLWYKVKETYIQIHKLRFKHKHKKRECQIGVEQPFHLVDDNNQVAKDD